MHNFFNDDRFCIKATASRKARENEKFKKGSISYTSRQFYLG